MEDKFNIRELKVKDELAYKKFIIESQRWVPKSSDPEWKQDLFIKDFAEVVQEFKLNGGQIVSYQGQIVAEMIKLNNKFKIFCAPKIKNTVFEKILRYQFLLLKLKKIKKDLGKVPTMLKRLFKYLPSWL